MCPARSVKSVKFTVVTLFLNVLSLYADNLFMCLSIFAAYCYERSRAVLLRYRWQAIALGQ